MDKSIADPATTDSGKNLNLMKASRKRHITEFGIVMLVVLAAALYLYTTFTTVVVSGESMLPTLKDGQRLLASKAYWLVGPIRERDIVVVQDGGPSRYYIKRVYKLAGGKVEWALAPMKNPIGEFTVPKGTAYVLGDNREVSEDSRKFGAIPLDQIIGKVVVAQ
jgi:signal peptidase I